jgi:hypothetical protein
MPDLRVEIGRIRASPVMPAGDTTRNAILRPSRQRWLAPSPPLPVDDEPGWHPASEGESERPDESDAERSSTALG